MMQVASVNVATAQPISTKSGMTGIYKRPQAGRVRVHELGLEGDAIVDVENHGGRDQAVYLFGTVDNDWWSGELRRQLEPGVTFGENLSITELESADYNVGDRFSIADVVLEVTSARIPCVTLAARMGDPTFVKRFKLAQRFGLYCRVIATGSVGAGDAVSVARYGGETISALEMFRRFYSQEYDAETLRRSLKGPLHMGVRAEYEARLAALGDTAARS